MQKAKPTAEGQGIAQQPQQLDQVHVGRYTLDALASTKSKSKRCTRKISTYGESEPCIVWKRNIVHTILLFSQICFF